MRLLTVLSGLVISVTMLTNAFAQDADSVTTELTSKCTYPKPPSIPNGKTASEKDLLTTQKEMKAYLSQGDEFLACLDRVQEGWSDEERQQKVNFVVLFHNRMVDDMNEVADLFNTSVRAYKGRK